MKLRIVSLDGKHFQVTNELGDVLEGVKSVEWSSDWPSGPKIVLRLTEVAIDMAVDINRVEASGFEDGKYARMQLKDVVNLRWVRR